MTEIFHQLFGLRGEGYMALLGGMVVGSIVFIAVIYAVTAYFSRER